MKNCSHGRFAVSDTLILTVSALTESDTHAFMIFQPKIFINRKQGRLNAMGFTLIFLLRQSHKEKFSYIVLKKS